MAGELEGLGGAVTGGMLARALEPHADGSRVGGDGHTTEVACLNCGTRLRGEFCHGCGQHAHVHRTLRAFGHDLLHGVLHLEGKIWRTLPMLMFKPGELTRRYIGGERARFVSPLALFLFSVFTMFAVMSFLGSPFNTMGDGDRSEMSAELQRERGEIDARLATLRQQRTAAAARGGDTAKLDEEIRGAEMARDIMNGIAGDKGENASDERAKSSEPTTKAGTETLARGNIGKTNVTLSAENDSAYNRAYRAAKQNPKLLAYKLQTNAYKFSWALIIISVPFVAMLFLWRWRPLYDHTVFVTYSITAVSILVIVGSLLVLAGVHPGPIWAVGTLFVPWHMYRQLRGGYGLRRFSALWRTLLLAVFATVALSLFAFGLLALGVLG